MLFDIFSIKVISSLTFESVPIIFNDLFKDKTKTKNCFLLFIHVVMRISERETERLSEKRQRRGEKGWGEGCPFVFGRGGRCQILGGLDTLLMPPKTIQPLFHRLFFLYPSISSLFLPRAFLSFHKPLSLPVLKEHSAR